MNFKKDVIMEKILGQVAKWVQNEAEREKEIKVNAGLVALYALGALIILLQLRSLL